MKQLKISFIKWLERRPGFWAAFANLVAVLLIGLVDYLTGFDLSVTLLYIGPVAFTAWRAGLGPGVLVAGLSAVVWLGAILLQSNSRVHPAVHLWNTLMVGSTFAVVAIVLAALKRTNENLEAMVSRRTAKLREEVAERRRAEEQLQQTNAQLQRTQLQLIEAAKMETVGRMAAGVAHEVKNPLMTLSMATDYFLQRKTANGDEAALLQDMKEAVRRASRIINLMLDFSRPRPVQLAAEDMNGIIDRSLNLMRQQFLQQRITVMRQFQPGLPPVPLDRIQIEHVFVNLMTNAAQAMPGGGTLTVRTALQDDSPTPPGKPRQVTVDIEDTGPGVPAEHLSKVFELFYTTKAPGQGTGLGLAIVRQIMQIHGGTVTLGNRPEGGARATLTFNLERKTEHEEDTDPRH